MMPRSAGVAVFPVGVGAEFDHNELSTLAGAHTPTNAIQLSSTDDLIAMATLGHTFYDKLCRGEKANALHTAHRYTHRSQTHTHL